MCSVNTARRISWISWKRETELSFPLWCIYAWRSPWEYSPDSQPAGERGAVRPPPESPCAQWSSKPQERRKTRMYASVHLWTSDTLLLLSSMPICVITALLLSQALVFLSSLWVSGQPGIISVIYWEVKVRCVVTLAQGSQLQDFYREPQG